ncbi:MAG: heat shock protein HspQ [Myxococcales bacterium]
MTAWKRNAKFSIGDVVKHYRYPFRGVIFDIDPTYSHTDEWWESIPADVRPRKDQPYYHLLADNGETTYVAYVSEQNLRSDDTGDRCRHPEIEDYFERFEGGRYVPRPRVMN